MSLGTKLGGATAKRSFSTQAVLAQISEQRQKDIQLSAQRKLLYAEKKEKNLKKQTVAASFEQTLKFTLSSRLAVKSFPVVLRPAHTLAEKLNELRP